MSTKYLTLSDLVDEAPMSVSLHPKHGRVVTLRFKGGIEAYVVKGIHVFFKKISDGESSTFFANLGVSLESHIRRLFSL